MATGVVFSASEFRGMYPSFAEASSSFLANCFSRASNFLNNTAGSVVQDLAVRKSLLYLATAHIATLETRGATVVGQMTSATQGSVSSAFAQIEPGNADYWNQTQYGAEFWRATLPYRSFRFV